MRQPARFSKTLTWLTWLACPGVLLSGGTMAMAQAGSEGGSIGGSMAPAVSRPRPHAPHHASPAPARQAPARVPTTAFDGTWAVSSGGACTSAGNSQVTIVGNRIVAQNGNGHVKPDGTVDTVGSFAGLTITGHGRIRGQSASGFYRQSDGCSGPWSAVKL